MLKRLSIDNFALIEQLTIEFAEGLHIITGETGAGKSIVIDALSLALGERADTTMIRTGAAKAVIEAEFETVPKQVGEMIAALDIEPFPCLILRREITAKGVSRCFVNDSPVLVSALKSLGDMLVDIHGQHEHQSLLRAETHIGILDAYGGLESARRDYADAFARHLGARRALDAALDARSRIEERRILIDHQQRTIDAVNPQANEDDTLERDLAIAEHAERLGTLTAEILVLLYDGDENATDIIGRTRKLVGELARIDPGLAGLDDQLESASAQVRDVSSTLRTYIETIDFSPEQCDAMRARLAALNTLKRNLRATLPEILELRRALAAEAGTLENIDATIEALERDGVAARADASTRAARLSEARTAASRRLAKEVVRELAGLGMAKCRFETRIMQHPVSDGEGLACGGRSVRADETGFDDIEFHIATNVGEDLKPLARTASGGEVSRIMLALKTLFAGKDGVPVLVFDEIDVGVSGGIAFKVGEAMRRLASHRQVIAITHLPQIAAAGTRHYRVEKRADNGRTATAVRALADDERFEEVARLIAGDAVTEASLASARELFHHE